MISYIKALVGAAHSPKAELIPVLMKNLGTEHPERSHHTVHASDVTKSDFCPRQYALMDVLKLERPPRFLNAALKATFDVGNATSDLVREQWMGATSVGNWNCTSCGASAVMAPKPTGSCTGKTCAWKYQEVNFVDPETKVSGSIDVLADLKAPKLVAVELKIMKGEDFEKLQAPLAEHRDRTRLYLKLIASAANYASGKVNTQVAKVLYVSRGFGKKSPEHGQILPFKEFDVVRDDASIQHYLEKPKALALYRAGNGPMPDGICSTPQCPGAKKCQVKAACFSGDFK